MDKDAIRKALRSALKPSENTHYNKKFWAKWLYDRLTVLAVYSYTDKNYIDRGDMNPKWLECLKEYQKSGDYNQVASKLHLESTTVRQYISNALTWIIDNTPDSLLSSIPLQVTKVRIKGCPKCHGDLIFDDTDQEYWCLACGGRYCNTIVPINKI